MSSAEPTESAVRYMVVGDTREEAQSGLADVLVKSTILNNELCIKVKVVKVDRRISSVFLFFYTKSSIREIFNSKVDIRRCCAR